MKVKILKSSGWYRNFVGSEFEIVEYGIDETRLPFKISGMGWVYDSDCVITELPESFCVKRCDDRQKWKKYIKWLNKTYNKGYYDNVGSYYGCDGGGCWSFASPIGTEIHIDDMIKHIDYVKSQQHINGGEQFSKESQLIDKMDKILKEETNMNTQKLSRKGLKEIHSVACPNWKLILEGWGSRRNPLENYIELMKKEVDRIFNACTKEQLPIVSKYLKPYDDGSVDLSKIACEVYLDSQQVMIEIRNRYEYCDKAFWLNDVYFNWEIKKDSNDNLCLIPTKKK